MGEFPSEQEILSAFERNPAKTFRLRELVVELGLRSSQARELKHALKDLGRAKRIVYLKKNHFALMHKDRHADRGARPRIPQSIHPAGEARPPCGPEPWVTATEPKPPTGGGPSTVVSGRFIGHRDGYGFVVPDVPLAGTDLDIYIPPDGLGSALHGDRVEVHAVRSAKDLRGDGRLEGRILRVTDRAQKTVVGEFHCGPRYNYVLPFDHRIPFEILIPRGQEWPAAGEEHPEGEARPSRHRQFGGPPPVGPPRARQRPQGSGPQGGESEGSALYPTVQGRATAAQAKARRSTRELEGLIVDVEMTSFPGPATLPRGRVREILGKRDEFGVDVEIMIRKFHLPHRFPAEALAEASATPQYISEREREGRRDFRGLLIVTIDGETAKDFDDAVHVERLPGGNYQLQVHIADVAHYVRPGTPLDREARLRGTSVYFPDRAVPMLPLELSNGICSLNPHVDRLVMSVLMEIDPQGRMVEYELLPGIIRSAERLTYTVVRDVLAGEPGACQRYSALVQDLKLMEELALVLNKRREQRGSIDFDLPEPLIEFDEYGQMVGITRSERHIAHRVIEEFMLAANETVATHLARRGVPSLYRIHEKPDPKKVLAFEEIAASFGYSLGVQLPSARRLRVSRQDQRDRYPRFLERPDAAEFEITPRHYQRLSQRLEGKPEERILSYLMLRSLKQARYSEENVGHFALAATTYTHFTSPIRRYPDLIVHRILKAALEEEGGRALGRGGLGSAAGARRAPLPASCGSTARLLRYPGGAYVHPQELRSLAVETSEAERRAADAERELIEWKKVSFMAQHVGDEFDALIISLTKFGFFVELMDLFVEGFVALANLTDDYYVHRERLRAIVGEHTKKAFHLGDRVRVRLDRLDRSGNKLEFSVPE